jgi:hypothetical protein
MNNKLLIFIIILGSILLVAPFLSAEITSDALTAKQFSTINIPMSGTNGTGPWPNCNITSIMDPDMIVALRDVAMTQIGTDFTYSFGNLTKLGTYTVNTICYDASGVEPNSNYIIVTTTGDSGGLSFYIILILLGLGFVLLFMSYQFDNQYLGYISGSLFVALGVMVMIYGFGSVMDMYSNLSGLVILGIGLWLTFATAFHHNGGELSELFGITHEDVDEYDYYEGKGE